MHSNASAVRDRFTIGLYISLYCDAPDDAMTIFHSGVTTFLP
jgi:hypothetical protein